jgi:hypothetical protein
MTMGAWATPREGAEEEHGHVHVAIVGAHEVVRAALKGQVLLANAVHPADAPMVGVRANGTRTRSQDTTGPSNRNSVGFFRRRAAAIDATGSPG